MEEALFQGGEFFRGSLFRPGEKQGFAEGFERLVHVFFFQVNLGE